MPVPSLAPPKRSLFRIAPNLGSKWPRNRLCLLAMSLGLAAVLVCMSSVGSARAQGQPAPPVLSPTAPAEGTTIQQPLPPRNVTPTPPDDLGYQELKVD